MDFSRSTTFFGVGLGLRGRGALSAGVRAGQIGLQLGLFNNIEFDGNLLQSDIILNDTRVLGEYRTDPGVGFDFLYFLGEQEESLYVGLGLYGQNFTVVGRSPSTDIYSRLGQRTIFDIGYSVGFMASTGTRSYFGFGYHTHLGWNLTFGSRR